MKFLFNSTHLDSRSGGLFPGISAVSPASTTASAALVLLCLALAAGAQAGTITKLGTGTDLTAGASWNGGTAPGSGDVAAWASTSLGASLTLGSATPWGNLSVAGALSDIGITGAGTLTLGGLDMTSSTVNMSLGNPVALSASQAWNVNSGKTLTSSGAISGTGLVLTKSGSGTLTLSGNSTYDGGTTLSAGRLNINNGGSETGGLGNSAIGNGPFSIAGGTIDNTAASLVTVRPYLNLNVYFDGDFTFNCTRSLQFRGATRYYLRNGSRTITVNSTPASGYIFNINGVLAETPGTGYKLTKDGPGRLYMNAANTFSGGFSLKAGHLSIGVSGGALGTGTFSIDGPSTIGSVGTITLNTIPQAWNADFGIAKYGGDAADGTAVNLGLGAVTLGGNRQVSVDSGVTLTVGGAISGASYGLTKAGPGTLTVTGNNTYGGSTTVNQGTLTLDYSTAVGSKIPDASGLVLGGGTITLSGGGTAHNEVVASTTINAGASAVTRASGTSVLRMNAITRSTGGTVDFGAASIADTDTSNVNGILRGYATVGGADWALSASSASDTAITALAAGSYATMVAGATSDSANDSTGSLTLSGNHSHNSLKLTTGATLALGTSSLTLASGGLLSVGSGASTISGSASPGLMGGNNGSGSYELIVHQYNTAGLTISAILGNSGANATALTKSGSSTLTLSGANTYTGGTYINAGTVSIGGDGNLGGTSSAVYLNGGTLANTVSINPLNASRGINLGPNGGTISAAASTTFAIAGQVTGTGQLRTAGTGFVNLGATTTPNNTYSGGTYVTSGSVLCVGNDAALGSSGTGITLDGGTLENWSAGPGDPNLSSSRTITITPNQGILDAGNSQNLTVGSKITGAGILFINLDSGLVILKNMANDYLGTTWIGWNGTGYQPGAAAATLQLGASEVIPNGPGKGNVLVYGTFKGKLDLAGFTETINGLTSAGTGATVDNTTGNGTLIVGDWDATATFGGAIQNTAGTLALTKIGAGTQTLSGVNTYTGGTTISAGTLEGSVSGSIPGNVTVSAGTLKLDNASTMSSGATLTLAGAPGAGAVNLSFAGTQTINALYFGSTQKAAGTWGAVGSGATHQNSTFTGTGLLNVTTGPATTTTVSSIPASCSGTAVSLTATVTGNGPTGTVQFYDNGSTPLGAPQTLSGGQATLAAYSGLAVGTHSITAKYLGDDNNNQSTSGGQSASVNAHPTAAVSGSATICNSSSTSISAALTGTGPWNVTWSDGTHQNGVSSSPATRSVSSSATTTYTVTALTDANCTAQGGDLTGSAVVTVNTRPTATVSGSATICAGSSTSISSALTGTGPWNVAWSDGTHQNGVSASPATRSVSPSATTTYTVTALTDANCSALGGDLMGSAVVTVNALPAAPNAAYTRAPGTSLKIKISDLTSDAVQSLGAGLQSATITQDGTYIKYLPQAGNNNADSFTYTAANANCTRTGTLTVMVVRQGGLAREIQYGVGGIAITFAGIPGVAYDVQRSASAGFGTFETLLTTNAPTAGVFSVTDTNPLNPSGFYRLMQH